MAEDKHKHVFDTEQIIKVPLYRYEVSNGKTRNAADSGYDELTQLKCECGQVETLDLTRSTL